jgi:hypothetical protein
MKKPEKINGYDLADAGDAIETIRSILRVVSNPELQAKFEAGLYPNLLSYKKVQESEISLPILEKYLIGATTYVNHNSRYGCNYYDIFRVCRCVNMVLFLRDAIEILTKKKVPNLEARLERLMRETEHDVFDSVAFELITAARYAKHPDKPYVEFIPETDQMTPDFLVRINNVNSFIECKKVNRMQNHSILIRDAVRDSLNAVFAGFRSEKISFIGDINFDCDPNEVSQRQLMDAIKASFSYRTAIIEPSFTITTTSLPRYQSDIYTLYPSPFFYWDRYGFRLRSEWFGLVHQLYGSYVHRADLPPNLLGGMSTWLHKVDWDSAVKWRISSEKVLAKYRRFAFDGLFKGLMQIQDRGINSCVHLWLESEYFIGGRKSTFLDLFNRLGIKQKDEFGWIIINETLFDVSPKGYFDLVEHAHMIRGPNAIRSRPLVSNVFVPETHNSIFEYGVGQELPDIDK